MVDAAALANNWGSIIAAIGGLGTAAFGLVDASKPVLPFVNNIGFKGISTIVTLLTPGAGAGMGQAEIMETLRANWINGTDLGSQKAIAKSLIKLHLSAASATEVATATGLDGATLSTVATKLAAGTALLPAESDLYARFDLIVTAMLDQTYQKSDLQYRNWTRFMAMVFAVILAVWAGSIVQVDLPMRIVVGLLATPLAPAAKDLATALTTAVNTMQLVKK